MSLNAVLSSIYNDNKRQPVVLWDHCESFKETTIADLKVGKGFHGVDGVFRPLFKIFILSVLDF